MSGGIRLRHAKKRAGKLKIFFAAGLLITGIFFLFLKNSEPLLRAYAQPLVTNRMQELVSGVIQRELCDSGQNYVDFISIDRMSDGSVSALRTNAAALNIFKANVTRDLLRELDSFSDMRVSVPLGNFIGNDFFSGIGPDINVRVIPVKNITAELSGEFTGAGINQTRYQVFMDINIRVGMLFPGAEITENVPVRVCIGETIIVGGVPDYYANLAGDMTGNLPDIHYPPVTGN